jgi:hypothetical protein
MFTNNQHQLYPHNTNATATATATADCFIVLQAWALPADNGDRVALINNLQHACTYTALLHVPLLRLLLLFVSFRFGRCVQTTGTSASP